MFSKKNKNDKIQILENDISNYKTQMISLSQEIQELRDYITKQEYMYQTIINNKDAEINALNTDITNIKVLKYDSIPDEYICKVCMEKPIDCILEPCMHFCMCQTCIDILPDRKCPICRQECNFYNKVFIS